MDNSIGVTTGAATETEATRFKVLGAISFSHFLNDMIQSLIIAIYPLLKGEFALTFMQIGAITMSPMLESHVSSTTVLRQIVYPFPLRTDATIHHRSRAAG